ncbi:MAG: agmatine deiminase family protein [Deinococcales bacterium]
MPSPAELGFSMPPEWEPHAATWTSWPFDDVLWEGQLEGVRDDMAGLVATVARYESVVVNVRDEEAERDAHRRLAALAAPQERIAFHRLPLNDAWFRDNGPIFVRDAAGRVALTDWRFNAWGGKYAPWDDDDRAPRVVARRLRMQRFEIPYVMEGGSLEVNGEGVCLTTRSCLLARERNPELDEHEVETLLRRTLGVRRHNLEALRSLRAHDGVPYRVVALPLPRRRMELGGTRLPPSYANFYIGNGFVVVPLYEDENDEAALTTLRPLFPGRDVIGLGSTHLITGGGAFHCVTQQQPAGEPAPEDAPGG